MSGRQRDDAAEAPYRRVARWDVGHPVISVALAPDGDLIAAAALDRRLHVSDSQGRLRWRSEPLDGDGWCVAVGREASLIAVGTARLNPSGGSVRVFDRDGRLQAYRTFSAPVWGVDIADDGVSVGVATWGNEVHLLRLEPGGLVPAAEPFRGEGSGFYGIRHIAATGQWGVAAFGHGIYLLDEAARLERLHPLPAGMYNVAVIRSGAALLVGLDDGSVQRIDLPTGKTTSCKVSTRPVCGVAGTPGGELLFLGSFDGRAYLCDDLGQPFWTYSLDGEVWSTTLSADGRTAVVGAGDGTVHILNNAVTVRSVGELRAADDAALDDEPDPERLRRLLADYARLRVMEYGCSSIVARARGAEPTQAARIERVVAEALTDYVSSTTDEHRCEMLLGGIQERLRDLPAAIGWYQHAAREPELTVRARAAASRCFEQLGHRLAAQASLLHGSDRRSGRLGLMTLYNLGRTYEAAGDLAEASDLYEQIVATDIGYRDVLARLTRCAPTLPQVPEDTRELAEVRLGWTGSAVASPEAAEPSLWPVLSARSAPLRDTVRRRDLLQRSWRMVDDRLSSTREKNDYWRTLASYLAYDYPPPADEVKKRLDLLHTVALIEELGINGRSLDIGTATGRYPDVLRQLGFTSFGVDLEYVAMRYANSRLKADHGLAPLVVGDGTRLPFASGAFDLVTCMMGTLSCFEPGLLAAVLREACRVLRPGGHFVCSTWDPEAPQLDLLAMYDQAQQATLRRNMLSQDSLVQQLALAGLRTVRREPFCIFPSLVGYDLGYGNDGQLGMRRLIELDLASRVVSPEVHGQMFTIAAAKAPA